MPENKDQDGCRKPGDQIWTVNIGKLSNISGLIRFYAFSKRLFILPSRSSAIKADRSFGSKCVARYMIIFGSLLQISQVNDRRRLKPIRSNKLLFFLMTVTLILARESASERHMGQAPMPRSWITHG